MSAGEDFVIAVEYGGLGDHLFFSHIPRAAKAAGWKRVLISNKSAYRSAEIRKLVWEMNPFVDGFTDLPGFYRPNFKTVDAGMNILDRKMIEMGVDDGKRMHEPELFYVPKVRGDVTGKTVLDGNFVSYVGAVPAGSVEGYLREEGIGVDDQLAARDQAACRLPGVAEVQAADVFDYCDVIASCGRFLCFTSGGATLAAALGKPAIAFHGEGQMPMFQHSLLHRYVLLNKDGTWVGHGA